MHLLSLQELSCHVILLSIYRSMPHLRLSIVPPTHRDLLNSIPNNCSVHLISNKSNGTDEHIKDKRFDVIVIDGLDRFQCASKSIESLNEGGAIILDDSQSYHPILDFFRQRKFYRVDFWGYVPGMALQHCTSVFFNNYCFLFEGFENISLNIQES